MRYALTKGGEVLVERPTYEHCMAEARSRWLVAVSEFWGLSDAMDACPAA